jgi:hypothetical protein
VTVADSSAPDPSDVFVQYRPRPRRRKGVLVAVGVLLVLIAGVYLVRTTVSSPGSTVTGFFDALADRDLAAALGEVAPEIAGPVERDVVNAAVLESGDYAPPAAVEVTAVEVTGRNAVVAVAFTIDGRDHTASLRLRRDEGMLDTVFHRWRLIDALGSIALGEVPEEVTVNGQLVAAHDPQGPRILTVLPGSYQVAMPPDDPLWDARSMAAQVPPLGQTPVSIPLVARPEVREEVDRQIRERLDGCATSTELLPPGCPFGNQRIAQATGVEWRITDYPNVSLSAGEDPLGRVAMLVETTSEGLAVVTGTQLAFGTQRPFEIEVLFPVPGTVSHRGSGVVFEPAW